MPWSAVQQRGDTSTGTAYKTTMLLLLLFYERGKATRWVFAPVLSWWLPPSFSWSICDLCCRLKIPRRPEWSTDMSPEILEQRERASFLEWRRDLAKYTLLPHALLCCAGSHFTPTALAAAGQLRPRGCCVPQPACFFWRCSLLVCPLLQSLSKNVARPCYIRLQWLRCPRKYPADAAHH